MDAVRPLEWSAAQERLIESEFATPGVALQQVLRKSVRCRS
jgi:hypothetical protein